MKKQSIQSRALVMAAELRQEAANLEQDVKALIRAAELLEKSAQKDVPEPKIEPKTDLKNAA
jgi:hypothetical protein